MEIRVLEGPAELAEEAAAEIAGFLAAEGHTIGLAGGSTPRLTYERLRRFPVAWAEVVAWMTDERHVPLTDPDSNTAMAQRTLFDHVPARLEVVPFRESAEEAAAEYEVSLRHLLPEGPLGPTPDLLVLGVGGDGHTASLFPGTTALEEDERDYVANWVPDKETWRLTATLSLLARARRTMFLASGAHKAAIVGEILGGASDLPAAVVTRTAPDPVWLIDRAAAEQLPG